jgi:hypothetical protein
MTWRTTAPPRFALLLFCLCAIGGSTTLAATPPDHWVGTWAASPCAEANQNNQFGSADTTLREIVHVFTK